MRQRETLLYVENFELSRNILTLFFTATTVSDLAVVSYGDGNERTSKTDGDHTPR